MDYKDSIKEINKLYSDKESRRAARSFLSDCQDKGLSFDVALNLLKASAIENQNKPLNADRAENVPISTENAKNPQNDALETVTDAGSLNMAEIEARVTAALSDFMTLNNIDDMLKAPQRQWTAACIYIGRHCFKGTDILKDKSTYDNGSCIPTNCGRYDLDKLVAVLNYQIYLCGIYNKAFTLDSGAYFCGTSDNFITENKEKLTARGFDPSKKSEMSIASGILDGKQNPTGAIAFLNHVHRWNETERQAEKPQNIVVVYPSIEEIRRAQGLTDKQTP